MELQLLIDGGGGATVVEGVGFGFGM